MLEEGVKMSTSLTVPIRGVHVPDVDLRLR